MIFIGGGILGLIVIILLIVVLVNLNKKTKNEISKQEQELATLKQTNTQTNNTSNNEDIQSKKPKWEQEKYFDLFKNPISKMEFSKVTQAIGIANIYPFLNWYLKERNVPNVDVFTYEVVIKEAEVLGETEKENLLDLLHLKESEDK